MDAASWKPGTTGWAYLITAGCCVYLAVSLPLALAVHTEKGWAVFTIFMIGAVGQAATAWLLHRKTRRATTPAAGPAPHHQTARDPRHGGGG